MTKTNHRISVLLALTAALMGSGVTQSVAADGPTVTTVGGQVRGVAENGVNVFRGIPYAAPPVGDLRWTPPQPAQPWEGVLDATEFGNSCPQVTTLAVFAGPASTTEDCLYLNVFTTSNTNSSDAKPVIVWIHGGANYGGSSKDYDGSLLATGGPNGVPTVVVTLNYRLGLLGFLSQSDLNAEGHPYGNYGIMDTQAALRWVKENIAAFGGDPNNVTLGGQSAGSINVAANVISPASKGLLHRAINMSTPIAGAYFAPADQAIAAGDGFAKAANCTDAECLRALPVARILQLQGTSSASGPYDRGPSVDGTIVPISPDEAWSSGNYNQMPLMAGSTADEWSFSLAVAQYYSGVPLNGPFLPITPEIYAKNSPETLAHYPLEKFGGDPLAATIRVTSDPFKCLGYGVLDAQAKTNEFPVYAYEFTYGGEPFFFPQMPNPYAKSGTFQAGAYHTGDIQFVFPKWHGGNLGVNLDPLSGQPRELEGEEVELSHQIVAAWTNFAATGNPNSSGETTWPEFTTEAPVYFKQDLGGPATMTRDEIRSANSCSFWKM